MLVGDASYSLYLVHVLPALILSWWWPVETLAILALGVAVHLAVEKPLLRRLRAATRRHSGLLSSHCSSHLMV